jgi:UDP-N-acetylmuramoyl-tripeptide--D-alanyl-D-alanine ligase
VSSPFPLTAATVAAACGGQLLSGNPGEPLRAFSTDTRTLRAGDAFIALSGPRFDGHAFVDRAVQQGAGAVIASDVSAVGHARTAGIVAIVVTDTLDALQSLARHVRRVSGARVVAITGSAGKTTTKEATASLLSTRFRTMRNRGNLNNHIGLPLSLLALQDGAEVAVVELGMNHPGEISTLVSIAEPDVRVWTNVGTAHLEFFGSMDAIAAAKAEVLEGATTESVFVANADDARVMKYTRLFPGRVVTFGSEAEADVQAIAVRDSGVEGQTAEVRTPAGGLLLNLTLPGRGHLLNVLAAVAVALQFSVPLADIATHAARLTPASHRGEVFRLKRGIRVLDDSYNSSPAALARTLDVVAATAVEGRKVAVLGEMLELGGQSETLHRASGKAVAEAGISRLITVGGPAARALGEAAREAGVARDAIVHASDGAAAARLIADLVRDGDLVVVKGSRGVELEQVVDRLKVEFA